MARRRTERVDVDMGAVLRRELIERVHERCVRFADPIEFEDGTVVVSPWPALFAKLTAGDPLELHTCELPAWARPVDGHGRVRVESDGSLTPVPYSV